MNKKQQFLEYMKKYGSTKSISATELASLLDVTSRTIRNYVKKINSRTPHLIETSRDGYKYSAVNEHEGLLTEDTRDYSIDSRRFYILRRLFKSADRGVDVFDLADTLYLSDASIRMDLAFLSQLANAHGLKIRQIDGRYTLLGSNKNKRKLMLQLVHSTTDKDHANFETDIEKFLDSTSLEEITKIAKASFDKFKIKPNTYFFKNFILHLAFALDRAKRKEFSQLNAMKIRNENNQSVQLINHMSLNITQKLNLVLAIDDLTELTILCEGEIKQDQFNFAQFVHPKVFQSLDTALNQISEIYLIDFSDEQFKKRLLLHVQNLFNRAKKNRVMRNVSLMEIKVKYPVLFDIAIYLSSILANDLNIEISDDEIAFLALHIGSTIENQKQQNNKIRAVLITPRYHSYELKIKKKIEQEFSEELIIVEVAEDLLDITISTQTELVITTSPFLGEIPKDIGQVVTIKEFVGRDDLNKIREGLSSVKRKKYQLFVSRTLPQLIPEGFYESVTQQLDKNKIFIQLNKKLTQADYVAANYLDRLRQRENLSSTAFFSGVAVPHTINYDGLKTGIYVLNLSRKIEWDGTKISLVVALAINNADSDNFNKIFSRMVELLAEKINVTYLCKSENRVDFIGRLQELMTMDGYYYE